MKIQIVIPAINCWDKYSKACIESVKTKHEYRILFIDNGSEDNTKEEAGKLVSDIFSHHRNEDRWSCAKSWNFGVNDAFERGFDYVLVLNNDIILHPDAIDNIITRFEITNTVLTAGVTKINPIFISCLNVRSECPNPSDILNLKVEDKLNVPESLHPDFSAFMINKECWEQIGEFDEGFEPAYFEDNDYHYRIQLASKKAICLPTAMFYHYGSGTQNQDITKPIVNGVQFEGNRFYFNKKWGGVPGQEKYIVPFNNDAFTMKACKQDIVQIRY